MFDMLIQGLRGTCGEDKMLAVLVGAMRFNLKRSGWLESGGKANNCTSKGFHTSLGHPPPTNLPHRWLEVVFLLARFKSRLSSKLGDKTL